MHPYLMFVLVLVIVILIGIAIIAEDSDLVELCILFSAICCGVIIGGCFANDAYLISNNFEPNEILILQGVVEGYNSEDKIIEVEGRKLDAQLLSEEDIKNIHIGGYFKAKIVFCPSGKIGVLELKNAIRSD